MKDKSDDRTVLKLENQICFSLYSATNRMLRLYSEVLKDLSLTYPQYLVMLVMWERQNLTLKQIGDLLDLDSGTLTPIVKRLEKIGYLQKIRSESDLRSVHIKLTQKGKSLEKKALGIPYQIYCMSGLDEVSLQTLKKSLSLISSN